ncbi:hypothetical protein DPMN_121581 [Dreissena polymorpha]|uniref:Uncharacterized protein n=1 Tax=Dreissena polymorpha TaxID=45954 RepID=A0A9D4GQS7_DREPO|nr:hypothetical protein DPMN_121581 [Dreissena polymorpha]
MILTFLKYKPLHIADKKQCRGVSPVCDKALVFLVLKAEFSSHEQEVLKSAFVRGMANKKDVTEIAKRNKTVK